ncbi:hypothetical protein D3C87_1883360 [compost metagenome]
MTKPNVNADAPVVLLIPQGRAATAANADKQGETDENVPDSSGGSSGHAESQPSRGADGETGEQRSGIA